jgi:hypothetical protein
MTAMFSPSGSFVGGNILIGFCYFQLPLFAHLQRMFRLMDEQVVVLSLACTSVPL